MTGTVQWPELVWIVGIILTVTLAVSGFACALLIMAWKALGELKEDLAKKITAAKNELEVELGKVEMEMADRQRELEARIRMVEAQQLVAEQIRKDYFEFRLEVRNEFRSLREERGRDMTALHARLNDLLMLPVPSTPAGP